MAYLTLQFRLITGNKSSSCLFGVIVNTYVAMHVFTIIIEVFEMIHTSKLPGGQFKIVIDIS